MSTRREVYLGCSTANELVFASVEIKPAEDRETTFIDHTVGPLPASVGIMFSTFQNVPAAHGRASSGIAEHWAVSGGQIPADERVIDDAPDAVRTIERMWADWHLNTLRTACIHMTEEMLNPADDVLDAYIAEREAVDPARGIRPTFYGRSDALQKWRLDNVVCPETGYRWGHAWLSERVPKDDLLALMEAVATLPRTAR